MALVKVTPPTVEPFDLEEAKKQLEETLEDEANDAFIEGLIGDAREAAEERLGRSLMPTTWRRTLDCFPALIELERPPVTAVSWVKYYDDQGVLQTLATSEYEVDMDSEPARIVPAYGKVWPATRFGKPGAVQVQYVAGHTDVEDIPRTVVRWIKLALTEMYQNRDRSSTKPTVPNEFADHLLSNGNTIWRP